MLGLGVITKDGHLIGDWLICYICEKAWEEIKIEVAQQTLPKGGEKILSSKAEKDCIAF